MGFRLVLLEEFGKAFVPKKIRPTLRKYLLKAGISPVPYDFFGGLFYVSAFLTVIIYLGYILPYLSRYSPFILLILSFFSALLSMSILVGVVILFINFYLDLMIYYRTRKLEEALPDFLQLVSSNLKGGMSFESALWSAIKPRFSILANEMAEVSKKVMTGHDVDKALIELSEKYDSPTLRRSVDLIISELQSGGDIAELVDRVVHNMKRTKVLKEDMAASALSYIIFISVIVVLIAPLLFSLSYSLLIVITNFMQKMVTATQNVNALPFEFSSVQADLNNFQTFSIMALSVISFFSAMIVSIVEKGDVRGGIKYIPLFITGALILYFIFMKVLGLLFSGLYTT